MTYLWWLALLWLLANAADVITTKIILAKGGEELSWGVKKLMNTFGVLPGLVITKAIFGIVIFGVLYLEIKGMIFVFFFLLGLTSGIAWRNFLLIKPKK